MDFYKGRIPIIDSDRDLNAGFLGEPGVIRNVATGMVPPDPNEPPLFGDPPSNMETIPESDWDAIYDEQEALQSSLEHMYLPQGIDGPAAFTNLDQNGFSDCWAFSTGHAIMFARLRDRLPHVRLNPSGIAVALNRLDGGWCGASAKYAKDNGCPVEGNGPDEYPLHKRVQLSQAALARAKNYRIAEDWYNVTREIWDQQFSRAQYATALLSNCPVPSDWNFMSHSVCGIRWVRIERGSWAPLINNSWKLWGWRGLGVIRGSNHRYAVPNNSVGVRVANVAA